MILATRVGVGPARNFKERSFLHVVLVCAAVRVINLRGRMPGIDGGGGFGCIPGPGRSGPAGGGLMGILVVLDGLREPRLVPVFFVPLCFIARPWLAIHTARCNNQHGSS